MKDIRQIKDIKEIIPKHLEMINEKQIKEVIFTKPLAKFVILIILQVIVFFIEGYFPNNNTIRIATIIISVLIIIYFILTIVQVLQGSYEYILNPKNFKALVVGYVLLILVILFAFSTLYNLIEMTGLGYLKYGGCSADFNPSMINNDPNISREFFYFSSVTFFTVGYGDVCPMGGAKIISIIASFMGHIVSVIIIALILNNYLRSKKEE